MISFGCFFSALVSWTISFSARQLSKAWKASGSPRGDISSVPKGMGNLCPERILSRLVKHSTAVSCFSNICCISSNCLKKKIRLNSYIMLRSLIFTAFLGGKHRHTHTHTRRCNDIMPYHRYYANTTTAMKNAFHQSTLGIPLPNASLTLSYQWRIRIYHDNIW